MIQSVFLIMVGNSLPASPPTMRARHAIEAGAFVQATDVEAIACAKPLSGIRFDRSTRAVRAVRPIAQGECLTGARLSGVETVQPGRKIKLVSAIGAVKVERSVEALQVGAPGNNLFVRGEDGVPFAVSYEDLRP